jgi:hypothetical protein
MKMFRATNTVALDAISHLVEPAENMSKEAWLDMTSAALAATPDIVYICTAVAGEQVVGFMAAFAPHGENVHVSQGKAVEGWEGLEQHMLMRVLTWAQTIGRQRITTNVPFGSDKTLSMQTLGFKPHTLIMSFDVTPQVEQDLVEQIVQSKISAKELENAQPSPSTTVFPVSDNTKSADEDTIPDVRNDRGTGGSPAVDVPAA